MAARHVVVIRRNHKYLKEYLQVDPVLDALLEDDVFTQEDYDRCRQAGSEKCERLLEILKKKGQEGYWTLCAVLDSSQPFIKQRLDETSMEAGCSDLVYVNKFKLEAQYKKELGDKEDQIAELQSAMERIEEQLKQKDLDHAEREEAIKKEREEHIAQLEKQKEEVETLKMKLSKSNDDLQQSQAECDDVKKRLHEEQQANEALSGDPRLHSPDMEDIAVQVQHTGSSDRMCQFSTQSCCEESQLCLLPCLHSACKPCIDHHTALAKQKCLQCPCGREFNTEQTEVDHVGRNEAAYAANVKGDKKCNYIEGDHDAKAEVYCHECDNLLCSDCHKLHDVPKRNRNHRVEEVNQTENIPMRHWLKEPNCTDHPNNELQLYDHTCKKAICIVCLHGTHNDHKKEDLNHAHEKAKGQLEEQLQNQRRKLKDVTDRMATVNSHQDELSDKQRTLEQAIITVCKSVAVKSLHRQRKLREEVKMSLEAPNKIVQETLDTIHDVHTSITSTIDYTQRTLESTRREELITITAAILKKCDENLKKELPEDDTRDTRILLSFQGQKALEELIDTFGGLVSCLDLDHIPDTQPTYQDLLQQVHLLTLREQETNTLHEGRWRQLLQIIHCITGIKESDSTVSGSQELQPAQRTSQDVYEAVTKLTIRACISTETVPREIFLRGFSSTVHIANGDSGVTYFMCPKLQLDAARANTDCCHVTTDGELVNSPPATRHRDSGRLQTYIGTCSSSPIPLPPAPSNVTPVPYTPRYWETHSRVGVVGGGWWPVVLEMGVGEESQVDSGPYVCVQRRSWCVRVWRCDTRGGSFCTSVCQPGERGECYRNTMSATRGTQATLHYGVVLDVGRGRLAFIDLNREIVLGKLDVEWRESLLPMFTVGRPDHSTVNMKVVSGVDITMTDSKKSLIYNALT
ncbi:early endosome antigen 1-like [Haliotis rufescens]|uniref:early endosome antigen 1-like n=1 Tax=Haliotis rufescens TaxID=6454 RepID=UPI00201F6265|nr:early endosome antigen 1-like [Haliotis rufescens]